MVASGRVVSKAKASESILFLLIFIISDIDARKKHVFWIPAFAGMTE
jgi:hypothetical protein